MFAVLMNVTLKKMKWRVLYGKRKKSMDLLLY